MAAPAANARPKSGETRNNNVDRLLECVTVAEGPGIQDNGSGSGAAAAAIGRVAREDP